MKKLPLLLTEPHVWDYEASLHNVVVNATMLGSIDNILLAMYKTHTYFIAVTENGLECEDVIVGKPSDVEGNKRILDVAEAIIFVRSKYLEAKGYNKDYGKLIAHAVKGYMLHDMMRNRPVMVDDVTIDKYGITIAAKDMRNKVDKDSTYQIPLIVYRIGQHTAKTLVPVVYGSDRIKRGYLPPNWEADCNIYADVADGNGVDALRKMEVFAYSPADKIFGKVALTVTRTHLNESGLSSYHSLNLVTGEGERIRVDDTRRLKFITKEVLVDKFPDADNIVIGDYIIVNGYGREHINFEHLGYDSLVELLNDSMEIHNSPRNSGVSVSNV